MHWRPLIFIACASKYIFVDVIRNYANSWLDFVILCGMKLVITLSRHNEVYP